jgi:steroid Delta-isomerase
MRKLIVVLMAAFALVALGGTANAVVRPQPKSPRRVVQAYVDDFNRGDAAAAASQFSSDAVFSTPLGGCAPCIGKDAIQEKLTSAASAHTQIAYTKPRVSKDTLRAASSLTSPNFPPGVSRAVGTFIATVRKGKIVRLIQDYDRSDPQTAALFAALGQ